MLAEEVAVISERFKRAGIGLKHQLGELAILSPHEVFKGLNKSVDRTVHGTKVERFRSFLKSAYRKIKGLYFRPSKKSLVTKFFKRRY